MNEFTIEINNNVILGPEGSAYRLHSPIVGLADSDIRTSSYNYSGQDGGRVTDQYAGMRLITITGGIKSTSCEQHEIDRRELIDSLPIRESFPVVFTTFAGNKYGVTARKLDLDMPIVGRKYSPYKIDLICPDALIYDQSEGEELFVTLERYTPGGFSLPTPVPIVWAAGSSPVNAQNNGADDVYPHRIAITGKALNPRITNLSSNQYIQVNISMSESDVLELDMAQRTVKLNGDSIFGTQEGSWWKLLKGSNLLQFNTGEVTDTAIATVAWRNGYWGI